jgi:hypothetical protein
MEMAQILMDIGRMTLDEIADELHERSWAMAKAPKKRDEANEYSMKLLTPRVRRRGRYIRISYGNENADPLTTEEAGRYLQWLRNGNVGTHRDARRYFGGAADA